MITTGSTIDDRDLVTNVENVFHISDSQVAMILSASSLAVFLLLTIVVFILLYVQNKATNRKIEKLMKKNSKMDDLMTIPTRSLHINTSPMFNTYNSKEKESSMM